MTSGYSGPLSKEQPDISIIKVKTPQICKKQLNVRFSISCNLNQYFEFVSPAVQKDLTKLFHHDSGVRYAQIHLFPKVEFPL